MSALGTMDNCLYQNCSVRLDYPSGVDGRGGNQPRYTEVVGNLVREVGLYQKQSGHWAQHLTARTRLASNIFFNGPHAAANFNDGANTAWPSTPRATARIDFVRLAIRFWWWGRGGGLLDVQHDATN